MTIRSPDLTPDLSEFRPELLSVREREVVDLAALGRTDEQIAQALDISTSTVNSYWVRIRGKIGFASRTEIVSKMLHLGYRATQAGLLAEVERLTGLLGESAKSLAQAKTELDAERGSSWHLLSLHFVPEAVVVAESPGRVVYANLQAERMFDCDPGALVGCAVWDLTVAHGGEETRRRIREFMEEAAPHRMAMGVEEPCYACGLGKENFRATILVEGFQSPGGFMGVFTFKEYLGGDMDLILRALRKPLVVV